MIVSPDRLIPFVAHKDEPVRQRVAYHFLRFHSTLSEGQKIVLVDKILLSLGQFGFSKNTALLELISQFNLLELQLKKFYKLFKNDQIFDYCTKTKTIDLKWNIRLGKNKKNDDHQQVLDLLKKIFFNHPFRRLKFLQDHLPIQFWKEYFEEAKRRSIFKEVKLFHQSTSEEALWSFLKKRFVHSSKNDRDFQSVYFHSLLEIWSNSFSGKFRDEIRGFFLSFTDKTNSNNTRSNNASKKVDSETANSTHTALTQRKVLFHLACIKTLKLRDIADVLPDFFVLNWPKKILIEIAQTMAVFRDSDFDRQMFKIYCSPKISSSKKSAILSYFSFVSTDLSEKYLLKISKKENSSTKKLEVAIAFSHLFSTHFIPYAMDLCKKDELRYFDLQEEIILLSSILGFSNDAYFAFAGSYFKKRSRKNYYSRIPFFLRSSQFFLSKKS